MRHGKDVETQAREHRAAWEVAVTEKKRLAAMRGDEASFRSAIIARRTEDFEALRVRPAALFPLRAGLRSAESSASTCHVDSYTGVGVVCSCPVPLTGA